MSKHITFPFLHSAKLRTFTGSALIFKIDDLVRSLPLVCNRVSKPGMYLDTAIFKINILLRRVK